MIPSVDVNYLAVLVSAVAAYILGALWYSPVLFGNLWMKLSNMSKKDLDKSKQKGMAKSYILNFVGNLVIAYVLAHIVKYAQATTLMEGIQTGFWMWLGFAATITLGAVLWEGKSWKSYLLSNAYELISFIIMTVILTLWV